MYSLNQGVSYSAYAPATSVAATTHQQQWDGSKWVESRVSLYTSYYHAWDAIAKEPSRTTEEKAWAKYNADLASCAAHYFHQNPNVTQPPPELTLPPAPPSSTAKTPSRAESNFAPASSVGKPSPKGDGMKRYMDRCLQRAVTEADRKDITEQIRRIIHDELSQNKGLNTIDWDARPLVSPSRGQNLNYAPIAQGGVAHSNAKPLNFAASESYCGPSHDDLQSKRKSRKTKKSSSPASSSGGYYGPASNDYQQSTATEEFIALPGSAKKKRSSAGSNKWTANQSSNGFDVSQRKLNDRASRFSGQGGLGDVGAKSATKTNWDKYKGAATIGGSKKKLTERDFEKMTCKGTCTTLEKAYLRLTAPPKPEHVRPESVLRRHLANLKKERKQSSRRDYLWFCSQFKAIRQDCTVQRIKNAFTVDVYETHARVALDEGDLNEFNQCQTQLIELYKHLTDPVALQNQDEFLGYRLIYQTFVMVVNGGGSSDLFKTMLSVTHTQQHDDPIIRHALAVRRASSSGDYVSFFRLYRECPTIWAKCLMDALVATVRFKGLQCIAKSYKPSAVSVDFVLQQLGLSKSKDGREWLVSCGCKLSKDGSDLLTKETEVHKSALEGKKSLI